MPGRRFLVLLLLAVASSCLTATSHAAITITGYAYGPEGPAIAGMTIEDFEDVTLIPGLTIRMGGGITTPTMWTGTLPHTWNPATASNCCTLGGPFPANTWDGSLALTNGGHGTGSTGLSPHNGNFWDFSFADSVCFSFSNPQSLFGVGLSNFQSIGGPTGVTNHELIVNGVSRGLLETLLPGYVPGVNVRFRYLLIAATGTDQISTVCVQNVSALDGLVFDKLAISGPGTPVLKSSWGTLKSIYR
jgi:hypothetical protein